MLLLVAASFLCTQLLQGYVGLERALKQVEWLGHLGGETEERRIWDGRLNKSDASDIRHQTQAALLLSNPTNHRGSCPLVSLNVSDVLVVLLTSATETQSTTFSAVLRHGVRCVPLPSIEVYSDIEDAISVPHRITIHDSFSSIPPHIASGNPEFALRKTLISLYSRQLDITPFRQHRHFSALQKWRVLQPVIDAYKRHPYKSWFVVIPSDTYLSWHNLLLWTTHLNASEPHYRGAQLSLHGTEFAALPAGIVLSRAAVARFADYAGRTAPEEMEQRDGGGVLASRAVEPPQTTPVRVKGFYDPEKTKPRARDPGKKPTYLEKWYKKLAKDCCGDVVLAEAMTELGISHGRSFPVLHGANPWEQDFSEDLWWRAPVTWGKMSVTMMEILSKVEGDLISQVR